MTTASNIEHTPSDNARRNNDSGLGRRRPKPLIDLEATLSEESNHPVAQTISTTSASSASHPTETWHYNGENAEKRASDPITPSSNVLPPETQTYSTTSSAETQKVIVSNLSENRRAKDTGVGRRHPSPKILHMEKHQTVHQQTPETVSTDTPEENEIGCETSFFDKLPRILMPILLLVIAVLGIFITHNIATFIQTLCSLPLLARILYAIPTFIFLGILIFMFWRLCLMMRRLHTFNQVSVNALEELQTREKIRRLCTEKAEVAKRHLEGLLKPDKQQASLFKQFAPENQIEDIKERLINQHNPPDE